jgi:copper resistance protein D
LPFIVSLSEFFNYILYSILVGHVVLSFVPDEKKPKIIIPKPILLLSVLGVIVFSFGPVLQVIFYFSDGNNYFNQTSWSILTDFQVGKAWIFIGWVATFLWMTLYVEGSKYLQAFWLFLMILAVGYASHVASLSFWTGLFSHSIHFLAVVLWTGILIHVAWFAKNSNNWTSFLKWFTPFAVGCMVIILTSGFFVMLFVVDISDYINSWALPYGQMLLLKHISIIPLLAFALINGFLLRRLSAQPDFNIRAWLKAETIIIAVIFFFTSILGTLSPPHDIDFTVKSEGASKWLEYLTSKTIITPVNLKLMFSIEGFFLILFGFMFLIMIFLSFYKKVKPYFAAVCGLLFIVSVYFGLVISIK